MNQLLQHLTMGGYALYVWPAYGLFVFVFLMNFFSLQWKKKQTRRLLQQWFKH